MPLRNLLAGLSANAGSRNVVLYTRVGCHLCDHAKVVLEKYRVSHSLVIREVDVDRDPALKERYDCCVPVVEFDGVVRFRGKVNEVLLKKLLR